MSHGYIYKCIILYYVTRVHIIVHKLFNWRNRFSSTRCTKVVRVRMHIRKRLPHIHQLPLRERVNRKRDFPRIHTNPSSATCPSANTHATLYTNTHTHTQEHGYTANCNSIGKHLFRVYNLREYREHSCTYTLIQGASRYNNCRCIQFFNVN